MFNPLVADLSALKISEIETKISELSKNYFIAANSGNSGLAQQVLVLLDQYRMELQTRNLQTSKVPTTSGDTNLDDLINIT